jgi:hypothetical protein
MEANLVTLLMLRDPRDRPDHRGLAVGLELPARSLVTIAGAIRRLPGWNLDSSTFDRRTQIERMLEETGG